MLELASDLDLPPRGDGWHMLREGRIPEEFTKGIPPKLRRLIFLMMELNPEKRPTARELFNDSTIQYYLRKRYPLNYSMARFIKKAWTALIFLLWVVALPFILPAKWLTSHKLWKASLRIEKAFHRDWRPSLKRQEVCALHPLNTNTGDDKGSPYWKNEDSSNVCHDTTQSPPLKGIAHNDRSLEDKIHCNDPPEKSSSPQCSTAIRELSTTRPAEAKDASFLENNGFSTPPSAKPINDENLTGIVGSSSPVSSRYVMEPGFARNIMSAPVRRPPYRLLRSGKFRSIPKLDFSLTDVDNAPLKEAVIPRQTAGREVGDRGSSADELDY
ncbi:unnamed protein product [Enterobius vermicularis]|uniref:Protein kinase domain-containing protein n=1 Tax=Enterobius vermicularis TaxID=51028 RepID=A0A0N4UUE3_ENTVE|nr:unnamed protein product [Enterobius vermicularis]